MRILLQARERIESTSQRLFEPEMHRLRGVVLEGIGRSEDAMAAYEAAVAIVERQGNVPWRDRAAEALASLDTKA